MRSHWQEKLLGPRTSLKFRGTPGKTVSIMVLFRGTSDPSLMLTREILNKLKEINLFYSIDIVLWPLGKNKEAQGALGCISKLTHILLMSLSSFLYLRESFRTWGGKRTAYERGEETEDGKIWLWGEAERPTRETNPPLINDQKARRKGQLAPSVQE